MGTKHTATHDPSSDCLCETCRQDRLDELASNLTCDDVDRAYASGYAQAERDIAAYLRAVVATFPDLDSFFHAREHMKGCADVIEAGIYRPKGESNAK